MEGRLPFRPMDELISQLEMHGMHISKTASDTYHVEGQLNGGIFELPGDRSSQFISGLLMALPLIGENSELRVFGEIQSRPYVSFTTKRCTTAPKNSGISATARRRIRTG